jgi:hypothetical protein
MISRIIALIALFSASAMAQQYYEASGSTQVFTLKAGAKAKPAAVLNQNKLGNTEVPRLLVTTHNGVFLRVQGTAAKSVVSVYNVAGKRILNIGVEGNKPVALAKTLPSGVYFARLTVMGRLAQTVRFRMVR